MANVSQVVVDSLDSVPHRPVLYVHEGVEFFGKLIKCLGIKVKIRFEAVVVVVPAADVAR